ncbi:hypothetical protein MKW92_017788, partial [Papaver armeniacum]
MEASEERIETTDDHPEKASEGYKYDESDLNQLKLDYAAADQDYMTLVKEQTDALIKRVELYIELLKEERFVNMANFIL